MPLVEAMTTQRLLYAGLRPDRGGAPHRPPLHRACPRGPDRLERAELGVRGRHRAGHEGAVPGAVPANLGAVRPGGRAGEGRRPADRQDPAARCSGRSTTCPRSPSSWSPACGAGPACRTCPCRPSPTHRTTARSIPAVILLPWPGGRPGAPRHHAAPVDDGDPPHPRACRISVQACCIVPLGWPAGRGRVQGPQAGSRRDPPRALRRRPPGALTGR